MEKMTLKKFWSVAPIRLKIGLISTAFFLILGFIVPLFPHEDIILYNTYKKNLLGFTTDANGYFHLLGTTGTGQELFSLDGDVLMTITGQDVMTLTITLDQQDIAKVSTGMTAVVEVAALKGQSFEAEITDIGNSGTNSGGSSKFTVELTLAMAEGMIPGMNATARIPLYTKMDAITIPVAALAETPGGTVVYTALDSETGEPASPVVVTTGVSDGEIVEILSGLNSGDTVYYSYYDTLELDHTAKQEYSFR